MDLDAALLIQRQAARIGELESWIALLVIGHGQPNGPGFRYTVCGMHAQECRAQIAGAFPAVSIEYDLAKDKHIIDVL